MCDVWQSQIHDSPSDGVTTDVLAAMNRVTLDIVGLAGEIPFRFVSHVLSLRARFDCWIGVADLEPPLLFLSPGFGYNFDALKSREDDLSSAFDAIMKTDNSPAQSTVIPLIGSIAPWIISIVSSRVALGFLMTDTLIRISASLLGLTRFGTVLKPLWTRWGWRLFKSGSRSSSKRK